MQGQRKNLDSFTNAVDYEQGASSDNVDMNQSASWNDLNMHSSSHPNLMSFAGANQYGRMFRGQGSGEPCSSSNSKNIVDDDGLEMEQGWPYSFRAAPGRGSRSEDVDFERSRMGFPNTSTVGPNVCSNSNFSFMPHARSTPMGQCADRIPGCMEDNHKHWQGLRENVFSNLVDEYRGTQTDRVSPTDCDHFGSLPGSSNSMEKMDGSGSSVGSWGQSSKRKLGEGASSQSHPSGNTGSFTQNPNNVNYGGPCNNTFSLNEFPLLPWPHTDGSADQLNHGNPSQSDAHHPLQGSEDTEYSLRNFERLGGLRNPQDFLLFDSSLYENARQPNVNIFEAASQPRHDAGSLGVRSAAVVRPHSRSPWIEPEDVYISLPSSGAHTSRQSRSSGSRSGDLTTVHTFGPNQNLVPHDGNYAFISATEPRNLGQDPTNWSLATGTNNPEMFSSTSRSRTVSNSRPLSPPPWIRHQNPPSQIRQRLSEVAPWTLFPCHDSETRNQNSRSPPLSSLPSGSISEAMISTRPSSHNELRAHRRLGPLAEAVARLSHPSREMAGDIEGRRMLFSEIRQVLGGVRRGDNIRMVMEDYMFFDPYVYHPMAESYDRHRDMRLDVDNMSYEELLALEERIGDVNTGLSEEIIRKSMKRHKYLLGSTLTSLDVEPCCVCQEDYLAGDDLGKLDCGHDFHADCIKQWLTLKNLCPICKTTGLSATPQGD